MKEYKIAKVWAIFIYIMAPLMIALLVWLLCLPFKHEGAIDWAAFAFIGPISLCLIALLIVGMRDAAVGKIVIGNESIYTISTFSTKELRFDEIKGYRLTDNYIFIEPKDKNKKQIKVSEYFEKTAEIKTWLRAHFADLNIVNALEEKEEILNDETLGFTSEQRAEKLKQAQKLANVINFTGGLVGLWLLFSPKPYYVALISGLTMPFACIAAVKYYNGLIRIDQRKGSIYPAIFLAIMISTLGLFIRTLLDFQVFNYSKVWLPALIIALALIAIFIVRNKEFQQDKRKKLAGILGLSIFMLLYGYSSVVSLNCILDKSEPLGYHATILDKRISKGKSTTYYLKLTPWGPRKVAEEVSVSRQMYAEVGVNEEVSVYLWNGKFGIPWFELHR